MNKWTFWRLAFWDYSKQPLSEVLKTPGRFVTNIPNTVGVKFGKSVLWIDL